MLTNLERGDGGGECVNFLYVLNRPLPCNPGLPGSGRPMRVTTTVCDWSSLGDYAIAPYLPWQLGITAIGISTPVGQDVGTNWLQATESGASAGNPYPCTRLRASMGQRALSLRNGSTRSRPARVISSLSSALYCRDTVSLHWAVFIRLQVIEGAIPSTYPTWFGVIGRREPTYTGILDRFTGDHRLMWSTCRLTY